MVQSFLLNVPFVFSTNGQLFVEFDRITQTTTAPRPLSEFPTPLDLRSRYELAMGFSLADDAARPLLMRYPGGGVSLGPKLPSLTELGSGDKKAERPLELLGLVVINRA